MIFGRSGFNSQFSVFFVCVFVVMLEFANFPVLEFLECLDYYRIFGIPEHSGVFGIVRLFGLLSFLDIFGIMQFLECGISMYIQDVCVKGCSHH